MADEHSVPAAGRFFGKLHGCGYVLTELGRSLLREHEPCLCEIKFSGLLIVCRHCGTVYGDRHTWSEALYALPKRG